MANFFIFGFVLIMKIKYLQNLFEYKNLNLAGKIKNHNYLFRISSKKDTFEKFKPLMYKKSSSIEEAKAFARTNFNITEISCCSTGNINELNSGLCKLYNINRGKISFPSCIKLYKHKNERFCGGYGNNKISINTFYGMFRTLAHETAHFNHEKISKNYLKMGKKTEIIESGNYDFSILEKFLSDKPSQKLIKRELYGYACSSPAEFVACAFEAIMCGKKLSLDLLKLYRKYEGPNAEILLKHQLEGESIDRVHATNSIERNENFLFRTIRKIIG